MEPARSILILMLMLHPRYGAESLRVRAQAIQSVARNSFDRAALVAIDFRENGFNPNARFPFGVTCCHRSDWTERQDAAMALQILHEGIRQCRTTRNAFAYYNTGRCCTEHRPRERIARSRWRRGLRYGRALSGTMERLLPGRHTRRR